MKRLALVAALAVATPALAQAPKVLNARLTEQATSGAFEPAFQALVRQQSAPAWIAYAVPVVPGHHSGCCGTGRDDMSAAPCYLEGRPSSATLISNEPVVRLEGDTSLLVLYRVENQQVGRIALFSPDCQLDAGGLPFHWLTGVAPADSVRLLDAFARSTDRPGRVYRNAVAAIALHNDASADGALERLVGAQLPLDTRKQAAFWLGSARGERGYEILRAAIERESSPAFRREATFGLSQSPAAGAVDTLIQMARADKDAAVRGQALFWLAQKAGRKAVGAITDAIENDPESQVKERAVFALSQLPKDEGVPLLIGVARSNRDPRVRQRAMFWLGQSKDPRAVAFFEEVLKAR